MIDTDNLKTASLYINNQLLSRGLLHDGSSINFADPAFCTDAESAATMGRIMSVVNDLILRRDRDAEHRESLSTTLRSLRAESLRQTNDLQRLGDKHVELQRKLNLADAAETSLRSQLKAAEAATHKLRDEAAKTRVSVAQTRAACANEVRKRDRQIETLKKAVIDAGKTRGERKGNGITSITVTGDIGGDAETGAPGSGSMGTEEEGCDLRMETNAFLAELARGLSEENEALLALVRRATARLREVSGLSAHEGDGHAIALASGAAEMAADMDAIVDHLRTILTNPSFVPIEEVVVRDDEINHLRDGWEKMENRWQEAVHLIDGWRRRMASSGRSVNMEELKMGLRLSPVRVRNVAETVQELPQTQALELSTLEEEEEASRVMSPTPEGSLRLVPAPDYNVPQYEDPDESDSEASSIFEDEVDLHELDVDEPNIQILEQSVMMHSVDSSPLPAPPSLSPLKELDSAGNRGNHAAENGRAAGRPGEFTTIVEENTWDLAQAEAPRPAPTRSNKPVSSAGKPAKATIAAVAPSQENIRPASAASQRSNTSHDSVQLVRTSQKQQSPVSQSLTKPTAASSLKQRQAHEPSPRNVRPTAPAPAATKPTPRAPVNTSRGRAAARIVEQEKLNPPPTTNKSALTASSSSTTSTNDMPPPPRPTSTDKEVTTAPTPRSRSPVKPGPGSRLPLPRTAAAPPQSPLTMATIAAKLAASEREADAARVRAKLKAARLGGKSRAPALAPPSVGGSSTSTARTVSGCTDASVDTNGGVSIGSGSTGSNIDPVKRPLPAPSRDEEDELAVDASATHEMAVPKPRKRERRASRAANRRRSTLNPWELENLITGGIGAATPGRS